jgi:hypothetical protein
VSRAPSDGRILPTCRGGSICIDSISAKRTQFEGAGVEAIDKISSAVSVVGGLNWGRVLAARETSAPSQSAPPKIAPPMAWDETADRYWRFVLTRHSFATL